jgi:hypothetical protein
LAIYAADFLCRGIFQAGTEPIRFTDIARVTPTTAILAEIISYLTEVKHNDEIVAMGWSVI